MKLYFCFADNVQINEGTGTNVATDDIGGVHYQYVKIADGTTYSNAFIRGTQAGGLDVNLKTSSNILTVSSVNSLYTISSAANIITTSSINAQYIVSSAGNIITTSSINSLFTLSSAAAIQSVTSTGMFGITSTVLGVNLSTISNIVTTSSINSSYVVTSAANIITVSGINSLFTLSSAAAIQSITSTGMFGVTSTVLGFNVTTASSILTVSATNPTVYSCTATSLDGTLVVSPYTTVSGYFSTAINIATSPSNKAIKAAPGAGSIYITHIKASTESHSNYCLVEDTGATKKVIWDWTYLAAYGGENATLVVPIVVTATKDLGLSACCTNFSLNIVGYVK